MNKETMTKEAALEAWNNPNTKILFEITFGNFENYWKECERFNDMPKEAQEATLEKLRRISSTSLNLRKIIGGKNWQRKQKKKKKTIGETLSLSKEK